MLVDSSQGISSNTEAENSAWMDISLISTKRCVFTAKITKGALIHLIQGYFDVNDKGLHLQ